MIIKEQKGAALVEFAIVLPFLAILAGGICEFGLLLYNQQVITNASREGARAAIVAFGSPDYKNDGAIENIVKVYCDDHLVTFQGLSEVEKSDIHICEADATPPCPGYDRTKSSFLNNIEVTVSFDYYFLLPSLFNYGAPKTLTAKTTMKLEQSPPS